MDKMNTYEQTKQARIEREREIAAKLDALAERNSMDKMKQTISTIKQALVKPYGEYQSGSYLRTSEDMIADRETWEEEDDCRDFDFTTHPYWVTTNDGMEPYGINDDADFQALQVGL